jgi:hypothetical protein
MRGISTGGSVRLRCKAVLLAQHLTTRVEEAHSGEMAGSECMLSADLPLGFRQRLQATMRVERPTQRSAR